MTVHACTRWFFKINASKQRSSSKKDVHNDLEKKNWFKVNKQAQNVMTSCYRHYYNQE